MRNLPPRAYLLRQNPNDTGAAGRPSVPPLQGKRSPHGGRPQGPPLRRVQLFVGVGPRPARQVWGTSRDTAGGAHPRVASSRPKSRRFAAVGLEMRLRARSCPCGAIHLQPLPYGPQENLPGLGRGAPWGSRADVVHVKKSPSSVWPIGQPPSPLEGEGFAGDRKGRPYGIFCTGSVSSSKPGADVEPHQP